MSCTCAHQNNVAAKEQKRVAKGKKRKTPDIEEVENDFDKL